MLIQTAERGTAGQRPGIDWAGTGYCQECGHGRVLLYPTAGFSGRHGSRRQRWVCGGCFARRAGHHWNAIADRAPINPTPAAPVSARAPGAGL